MNDLFSKKDLITTVYQEKSFSRAAQKLFISQPALSVMIRKIEEDVGTPLFDRSCKPIRMTEAGMEYIRTAETIRLAEQAFVNYVDAENELMRGSLSLGSNQLMSTLVLPKYISAFIARYPGIRLHLVDDNSTTLKNLISTGQLDLIIDNQMLDPEIFEQRLWWTETLLLAVPERFSQGLEHSAMSVEDILLNRHQTEDVPAVALEHFAEAPFILMTRHNETRGRSDLLFRGESFRPRVLFEVGRLETLYNFVELGTAASIVTDTLIKHLQHHSGATRFYRLQSPQTKRDIYISYKRNRYYSRAMETLIDLLTGDQL